MNIDGTVIYVLNPMIQDKLPCPNYYFKEYSNLIEFIKEEYNITGIVGFIGSYMMCEADHSYIRNFMLDVLIIKDGEIKIGHMKHSMKKISPKNKIQESDFYELLS